MIISWGTLSILVVAIALLTFFLGYLKQGLVAYFDEL